MAVRGLAPVPPHPAGRATAGAMAGAGHSAGRGAGGGADGTRVGRALFLDQRPDGPPLRTWRGVLGRFPELYAPPFWGGRAEAVGKALSGRPWVDRVGREPLPWSR